MPRPVFANNNFYHVYNRGALKEPIFFEETNYMRFVHDLWEFNDTNPAIDIRITRDPISVTTEIGSPNMRPRRPVVTILAWCLMPNHFHLLIEQRVENGVSLFMKKLGIGYTAYINKKYARSGHVFQGRFKAKHIDGESYFLHISRYIHLNPVSLIEPEWKEKGVNDWEKINSFLEQYRWSSYPDWIGKKNFPSLLDRTPVEGYFKTPEEYKQFVREWTQSNYEKIKQYAAG